jgi:CRISPR-associated protein Cas1
VLYYRNRGKDVHRIVDALEQEAVEIERADSVAALMGAEGRMREVYYRAFNEILDLETPFLKRVRRPPDNLVNALISFGNSLLYAAVLSQIYRTPLNPTISYLHEPGTRRFSLALDIAEVFKPMIVDKMIFTLINRQMLGEEDLVSEVGFVALKERARKVVVQEFERRLQTTVKHRRLGRHVSYRGFIRLECYKLVRHLLGAEPYQALRAWW